MCNHIPSGAVPTAPSGAAPSSAAPATTNTNTNTTNTTDPAIPSGNSSEWTWKDVERTVTLRDCPCRDPPCLATCHSARKYLDSPDGADYALQTLHILGSYIYIIKTVSM